MCDVAMAANGRSEMRKNERVAVRVRVTGKYVIKKCIKIKRHLDRLNLSLLLSRSTASLSFGVSGSRGCES
jgi:hypothetical protein